MVGEVLANATAERLGAQVLLEHPDDRGALFVGERVVHRLGIVGGDHVELDGPGGRQRIDGEGFGASQPEADPAVPVGTVGIGGHRLAERREGLLQPNAVPPPHGHEVAEPHVGDLVRNDVDGALLFRLRTRFGVHQKQRLAEDDTALVLHGAEGEVGHADEVELLVGVGNAEVVGEVLQAEGAGIEGEGRQRRLALGVDDPQRHAVHIDWLGGFERADHERQEVGRHLHGGAEVDPHAPIARGGARDLGTRGDGQQVIGHDERNVEGGLQIGLVPARERSPRTGRFELGGGNGVFDPVIAGVGRSVEAAELVVEHAGELDGHRGRTRFEGGGQLQCQALGRLVEPTGCVVRLVADLHPCGCDGELGGVEHDAAGGFRDVDVDLDTAGERRRGQVGLEEQSIGRRHRRAGEAIVGCHGSRVSALSRGRGRVAES